MFQSEEHERIEQNTGHCPPWSLWGPYVSERAWATVREDYSADGDAWRHLPHDQARSKAYRWGEDGLAGICDRYQTLVFALGLWNGNDAIIKERLYGLDMWEGNHGEDCKEYYFYPDNTPTHSYMRFLYKYPQQAFPYRKLIDENRNLNGSGDEFELLNTGVFNDNEYFDVEVQYAKNSPTDICIVIKIFNRYAKSARLHLLPQLWFRNTWSWQHPPSDKPFIALDSLLSNDKWLTLQADNSNNENIQGLLYPYKLPTYYLYAEGAKDAWFTENETNNAKVYGQQGGKLNERFVKDAFHRYLIDKKSCLNPNEMGSKACLHYPLDIGAEDCVEVRLRLSEQALTSPFAYHQSVVDSRKQECETFFRSICPPSATQEELNIQKQAYANLLWNKQFYLFNVRKWLEGDFPEAPPPKSRQSIRNQHWRHLNSKRILIMPDKWEYPWFAAWDLAFACIPMARIDPSFAKEQMWLMLFEQFQHPNGQIPAYEWDFSDLNPPVHAWVVWRIYNMEKKIHGRTDRDFLERCFHKLLINFTWWVNKVDHSGNNIFEGGFLGLDNISVIDRSEPSNDGSVLEQSDATGWMAMFSLNMMRIALELAHDNSSYENLATKFLEHYFYIGSAMKNMGGRHYQLWDENDGFFYDILRKTDSSFHTFRVRSLVGLIPIFAVERLEADWIAPFPSFSKNLQWFLRNRSQFSQLCCHEITRKQQPNYLLSIPNTDQLRRILEKVFDETEFLSPFGMRSMSKFHQSSPFHFGNQSVRYEPAEAESKLKGGNSNWRGPVWFPVGFLMIEALRKYHKILGNEFTINIKESDSVRQMNLLQLGQELADRMIRLFAVDAQGKRPVNGNNPIFDKDPHWRHHILFHEYFHAETGKGLGAMHQTWTSLVASLIDEWR
jgi:mannosylglycerate hydrolase MGH1-like protein